jgi:hypothetical protein
MATTKKGGKGAKGGSKGASKGGAKGGGTIAFTAALEADDLKLQLLDDLNAVLTAYESQRAPLLQAALNEGGMQQVQQLESEYSAIQSAFFELLNRSLAANGGQYTDLMNQTIEVTKAIKGKINQLQGIADLINNIAGAVNLVGRIIVLFGL